MNAQLCFLLVIFSMHSTIFVKMCSPGPSPRPISSPNPATVEPNEATTRRVSAVNKKEMMFAPIKGKVLTDVVDE